MVRRLIILLLFISNIVVAQQFGVEDVKKMLKFSTFYAAVNGGTSLSDVDIFSVDNGLSTQTISTPYDYNFTIGLRKIARFGYENKAVEAVKMDMLIRTQQEKELKRLRNKQKRKSRGKKPYIRKIGR